MTSYTGRAARCVGHKPIHYYYRLTCLEFEDLVRRAEGRCDRCGMEMSNPCIEHDHAIGRHAVRGLTCTRCNLLIAAVERGFRDHDDLTRRYLAAPFHSTIPRVLPGLRPSGFDRDNRHAIRDPYFSTAKESDLVTVAEAAELLGTEPWEVRMLTQRGQLVGKLRLGSYRYRRVVVGRVALVLADRRSRTSFWLGD
ncbi:endonuclease domain-containing protein [Micromonospora sp. NPDC047753]|uniref:endonuclease domain-containing protein n=1 Tax=Micromonospora sp. NPDC047753 TaxID=3154817 RepID=UPI0033D47111